VRDKERHDEGFDVVHRDPFVLTAGPHGPVFPRDLQEFIDRRRDRLSNHGPAEAVPVTMEQVLAKDTVTVTVEARDEVEARRKGTLLIKATGRVPPKAAIVVEVPPSGVALESRGARVSTWKVTGLRKQSIVGEVTGWVFYGWV
jgi:hypothetical protein